MTSEDVEAVTLQHVDDVIDPALLGNSTARFCGCSAGGANISSAQCHLVNDYNITLLELCDDQPLFVEHQQVYITLYAIH